MQMRIIGSGSCIPEIKVSNRDFENHHFIDATGKPQSLTTENIIAKCTGITGIEQRRYAPANLVASDLAAVAARRAIEDSGAEPESIDYIIMAHNFGDVPCGTVQSDTVPSIASRVKHKLGIRNPKCVAYDILFGCPGWIEGMIQANAFLRGGMARRCLVIGAETLSRVIDRYDRDSMIYGDGAGAALVALDGEGSGLLSHESASYTFAESDYLYLGNSYNPEQDPQTRYMKMHGHKIYQFALSHVPYAMKACLDKAGISITEINKILIHQANEKMDEAIVERLYKLYGSFPSEGVLPMSIRHLGNSSVATVPTLYDLIKRRKLQGHSLNEGDVVLFASVGAGMNINAFAYRI